MNIVLLESLGISDGKLNEYAEQVRSKGHAFSAFQKNTDEKVMIERACNADVIMIANMPLTANVINACPNLKFIDIAFTGFDHVALDAAKAKGVKVSNAAGYATEAVAELAISMMISLLRNVPQVEIKCRDGGTKEGLVGREMRGKTLGIVGVGAIGRRVAELAKVFGCKVVGYEKYINGNDSPYVEYVSLDDLLASSDIVSIHCPLNNETKGLFGKQTIQKMRQSSILLNLARGPIVDSVALAEALNAGYLHGAGIDVFEKEPPIDPTHPLLNCRNTLVTPHIAFASEESMEARAKIVFDNIWDWSNGKQSNIVT